MENSSELINTFLEESHEHLPVIESGLLKLEKYPQDMEQINLLFLASLLLLSCSSQNYLIFMFKYNLLI